MHARISDAGRGVHQKIGVRATRTGQTGRYKRRRWGEELVTMDWHGYSELLMHSGMQELRGGNSCQRGERVKMRQDAVQLKAGSDSAIVFGDDVRVSVAMQWPKTALVIFFNRVKH